MLYAIKRTNENYYLSRRSWWEPTLTADSVYDGHEVIERLVDYDRLSNKVISGPKGILAEAGIRIIPVAEKVVEQTSYVELL